MVVLGIETSCDETAVGICVDGKIVANVISSQIKAHQPYGGVVPELAARLHTENIDRVLITALKTAKIKLSAIDLIAYTAAPGLINALILGKTAAIMLGELLNVPVVACNHLEAHLYAAEIDHQIKFPALGLIVSGGHTQLFYLPKPLTYKLIGTTLDDAAGETLDKLARYWGLNYPGGPEIEQLAKKAHPQYQLPFPKHDQSLNFSFSGLKSAAKRLTDQLKVDDKFDLAMAAASLQAMLVTILITKVNLAIDQYHPQTVIAGGGVLANQALREALAQLPVKVAIADRNYCTDNGAMIAALAYARSKSA